MIRIIIILFLPLLAFASNDITFKIQKINVGKKTLKVEIADTEAKRSHGLMNRKVLADGTGMLFIFENEQELAFWMKNTFIPLSIGFFSGEKKLIDIQDMAPVRSEMELDPPRYVSKVPAKYVLEVPRGWFKKNQIKLGNSLVLP
jgi:uncharacterized membrane protein (UPF0127 family)